MEALRLCGPASLLCFVVACDWSGFEPKDRELVACWPNCGPDAAVLPDAADDAGVAADGGDAAVDPVDLGVDTGVEEPHDSGEPEPDAGLPDGGLDLAALDVLYQTANTITFAWDPAQVPANAEGYVLRYSPTLSEVQAGGGTAWNGENDGNLNYRFSPHGPGLVSRTTITGLSANSPCAARLYAIIPAQGPRPVAEGTGHTIVVPEAALTIFADELPLDAVNEGFLDPAMAARTHDGTQALWFVAGELEHNASLSNLGLLMPDIMEARFAAAYLEMFVYVDFAVDPQPTYFIHTSLGGMMRGFGYSYTALPSRADWIQVQLAVAGFETEGSDPLTSMSIGEGLARFGLAGQWPQDATVYVDDVVFRY